MNSLPLSDMSIDTFLSEYWQKKPLLIRNALPNVTSPVSAEILAGLACEENVESRIIIKNEGSKQWQLKHGPFSEETFSTLPESQWTLLVQAVDHWIPKAAEFLELFTFIPRWRIDDLMISYATDGGGVGPHYDNYDVFLVQTNGKRKWEIGERYGEHSPLIENLPVSILSEFKAVDSWILSPGDILYVPPGVGHSGAAVGNECITCSVGFRAPSHTEILREFTDHISENLSDSKRYSDADLVAQTNTGEISQQALDKVQNIFQEYIQDPDSIAEWFGCYMTTPKYSQPDDLSPDTSNRLLKIEDLKICFTKHCRLIRNESSRFAYQSRQDKHLLFVDGQCIETFEDSNSLIELLCSEIEINNEMFPDTDHNMYLLLTLLKRGALYIPDA